MHIIFWLRSVFWLSQKKFTWSTAVGIVYNISNISDIFSNTGDILLAIYYTAYLAEKDQLC